MESGLQELKFSRYNQKVELSGKLFLYNALTGGYASVDEEYRDNFDKCDFKKLDSMKELAELPNAIINQLMEGGFIIPKNFDEFNVIKSMHYRGRFGANKALTMTLIPTMNCNFRCPYCYEKDKKYPVKKMTTEVMDAIIKYVESRIDSVDHIFVTWYGGEPLLGLHEIRIMQNKLIELASQKDVQVSGMIITNGYGLTKEISDELVQMQIKTAQVTIDGPEEIHNRTRFLKNGEEDNKQKNLKEKNQFISERLKNEFDIMALPFLGCNFDSIYPKLAEIIPREQIVFDSFGQNILIMSEIVCAGICHQMNWDYLRSAIYNKLQEDYNWILPHRLVHIEENEVAELFRSYNKPERVRAKERTRILREIGEWAQAFSDISSIFLDSSGNLLSQINVRKNLLLCNVLIYCDYC